MSIHERVLEAPRTKNSFRRMYQEGAFGNKLRTWASYEALCDSDYHGQVSGRHVRTAGLFIYNQSADALRKEWALPEPPGNYHFNETPPDSLMLIQGELSRQPTGLDLQYSTELNLPLREVINRRPSLTATGIRAKLMLEHYLWPRSQDDIWEMLDAYPDGVLEFSAFAKAVGHMPYRNAIVWEVRNY